MGNKSNKKNKKNKNKMSGGEIFLRFIFGFLLPFVVINGIILFLFIQMPKITVIDTDSKDYEDGKIKFSVSCMLPINSISTFFQENAIPYTKFGDFYIIEAKDNGTYKIQATSLNNATANSYVEIETHDTEPPVINSQDAVLTTSSLTFTVSDSQSGINYDNIYATTDSGKTITPTYIDKSSGTIKFNIGGNNKLIVHIEDLDGNVTETAFIASD